MTVWGSQGVPKSFIFMLRMPKTGPKASILKGLGHNLCISICVFEYACVMFLLLQFSFDFLYCDAVAKPASSTEPSSPAKPNTASIIGATRRTQQNQRYQQKPVLPAESVSPAKASRSSITSRRQPHQQKQTSPAETIITSTTSRTRHDKQHRQCRPKPAEPADASISSRASFTSRKPPQNQHQNPKPASFAKAGRNKHNQQQKPASLAKTGRNKHHQQKTPAEPASTPEASIISKNWQKQASPSENPRRTSIKSRS